MSIVVSNINPTLSFSFDSLGNLNVLETNEAGNQLSLLVSKTTAAFRYTLNNMALNNKNINICIPPGSRHVTDLVDGKLVNVFGFGPYSLTVDGKLVMKNSDGSFTFACFSAIQINTTTLNKTFTKAPTVDINSIASTSPQFSNIQGITSLLQEPTGGPPPVKLTYRTGPVNTCGSRYDIALLPLEEFTLSLNTGTLTTTVLTDPVTGTTAVTFPDQAATLIVNGTPGAQLGGTIDFTSVQTLVYHNNG